VTTTQPPTAEEKFAAAVEELVQHHGMAREPAERAVARDPQLHNVLVRLQQKRTGHVPDPPREVPPAKPRTSQLLVLLNELKVPPAQQMDYVIPARQFEDPEKWIREKVAAVAEGREDVPGAKGKCPEFVAASAGMIVEDLWIHHNALEQCLMDAASKIDINNVPSRHAVLTTFFGDEARILFRHLRLDGDEVLREWQRCSRLIAFKALAGTKEERAASRARLAESKKKCEGADSELAKLQAKLDALTEKVAAIRKEYDDAAADVQQKTGAVQSLAEDCQNENLLVPSRRLGWPPEGVGEYVRGHVGLSEEEVTELRIPERIQFGARRRDD